jgi:hypothetical protein
MSDADAIVSSPASASPSLLTADQRAAIKSTKATALSKRNSLLKPLAKMPRAPGDAPLSASSGGASTRFHAPGASAAAASAAAFELMSPTSRLSSQLRANSQASRARLRGRATCCSAVVCASAAFLFVGCIHFNSPSISAHIAISSEVQKKHVFCSHDPPPDEGRRR